MDLMAGLATIVLGLATYGLYRLVACLMEPRQ